MHVEYIFVCKENERMNDKISTECLIPNRENVHHFQKNVIALCMCAQLR